MCVVKTVPYGRSSALFLNSLEVSCIAVSFVLRQLDALKLAVSVADNTLAAYSYYHCGVLAQQAPTKGLHWWSAGVRCNAACMGQVADVLRAWYHLS